MISLVIPNLNTGNNFLRTLKGILKVKKLISEVIIIDGYSDDNSGKLLRNALLENKIKTHLYLKPRNGIIDAINEGVKYVKSEYILINLSGDQIVNLPKIKNLKKDVILYGKCNVLDKKYVFQYQFFERNPFAVKYRMPKININSIIWPADFLKKSTTIRKSYRVSSDYALILEAYTMNYHFEYNELILSNFFNDGLSSNNRMFYFGLGELSFICIRYGSALLHTIYMALFITRHLLTFIKNFNFYLEGYNHAFNIFNKTK